MRAHEPDYILLTILGILIIVGLVTLFSASSVKGEVTASDPAFYLKHQILYGLLPGAILFFLGYRIHNRVWQKFSFFILIGALLLLFLVFTPQFGLTFKGAARWLKIGPDWLVFQPAEFFKLGFITYLASFFATRQGKMARFSEVSLPFLLIILLVGAILILQPAAGTLAVIAIIGTGMYVLAGMRMRDFVILALLGAIAASLVIFPSEYRRERVMSFLNPTVDPQGAGYQVRQAMIGIGSGGILGKGLGHSLQKYNFLPETIGDSIFAIYAEELGFVGSVGLMILLLLFAQRGFKIAKNSREVFSRFLAGGITLWVVSQAFLNIASISGLLPLTGLPLPFFSYGGSAIASLLGASGMLLNISRYTR